jgi:hypothetical protein
MTDEKIIIQILNKDGTDIIGSVEAKIKHDTENGHTLIFPAGFDVSGLVVVERRK